MGKVIKETLATEDNDPMGLLGTWVVFTPRRFIFAYHVTFLSSWMLPFS